LANHSRLVLEEEKFRQIGTLKEIFYSYGIKHFKSNGIPHQVLVLAFMTKTGRVKEEFFTSELRGFFLCLFYFVWALMIGDSD